MKKVLSRMLWLGIALSIVGCDLIPQPPDSRNQLFQIAGCQSQNSIATLIDSCFTCQFQDRLIIDFCVTGNCCPDSNRFQLSHQIIDDHITLTAIDTAANLCNCMCPYVIHAEIYGLPLDRYIVTCFVNHEMAYREEVRREGDRNDGVVE
jgi:hypothetical protein